MPKKLSLAFTCLLFAFAGVSQSQTLQDLTNQPGDGVAMAFLLTDGTVMSQGFRHSDWWKLTPDISGSYLNGTWMRLADLTGGYGPNAFASAVLADGRLVIVGGEFNLTEGFTLTNKGAVYDPLADRWSPLPAPAGWEFIGEVPSTVLPDGRFLIG